MGQLMQNKKRIWVVSISVTLIFMIVGPFLTDSAALDQRTRNTILVAYMNGYVHALQLNMKKIKLLKTDKQLLRQTVEKAASEYIITVEFLNKN
jgi:hypothetical protein